jgi:hypothetical protein
MSAIDVSAFDADLVNVEVVHTKPASAAGKAKTSVRISYGPARRSIALVTPPCVVDWPMLHGDGDFGSKYGPPELDKAQYKVDVTDQGHAHEDREAIAKYFGVLRAIDDKLVAFVHLNQRELLGTRDLSEEGIRAKLNASAKDKYDTQDVLQFTKQTLATRKFDWKGRIVELHIVDAQREAYAKPIEQGDVCIVAAQIDYVYFIPQQGFGVKWGIVELMRLCAGTGGAPSSSTPQRHIQDVPAWAMMISSNEPFS